jgi:hypothetical protein
MPRILRKRQPRSSGSTLLRDKQNTNSQLMEMPSATMGTNCGGGDGQLHRPSMPNI